MEVTFGSLFAGIGGIDLGFERAGFTCKWQVEIDDYANKVLEKHWPKVHRERDINECGKENLEWVDVIVGGFPCQDLSYAGRGAGLDGERSGLFFETVRLVCELRPRIIMLENVAALLTRGLDRVLGTLAAVGYDAEWHCIPAAAVGAPHIRDRVFIIASANGGRGGRLQAKAYANSNSMRRERFREEKRGTWPKEQLAGLLQVVLDDPIPTRSGGGIHDGISNRVDRLRGLGNAVVPQVAEFIAIQIMENYFNATEETNSDPSL